MSLASEEISVMNSTQHSMRRSRASLAKVRPVLEGRISVMIFWTVAVRSYVRVSGLVDYIWDLHSGGGVLRLRRIGEGYLGATVVAWLEGLQMYRKGPR